MTSNFNMHARKVAVAAAATMSLFLFALPGIARADMKIQEVKSSSGVSAWLVEDYSNPIISIRFSFEGGTTQDPEGKEGLVSLMTSLFDEGAGQLDSEAFQSRLDDTGAEMQFSASRDSISGAMRLLAEKKADAFDLLRMAINEPRFDKEPLDRLRDQTLAGIAASARDPEVAAQVKWAETMYGGHPYARRSEGTEQTLPSLTGDDLHAMHKAIFARENLKVAVVGAIDPETLKADLDKLFGSLPQKPTLTPIPDVQAKLGQEMRVDYPLPQTSILLAYPGVARNDSNFFGAVLMNHILGGGTFSSRLFDEVREKRGLTYGVTSSLMNDAHSSGLMISTSTRTDKADETLGVVRDVVKKMVKEGPTEAELEAAKKYLVGSYAINNLDSSGAIAATLVELQEQKLGIDYMERRADFINAVTVDDVKAAAKKLLGVKPAVMIVGSPAAATASMGSKG